MLDKSSISSSCSSGLRKDVYYRDPSCSQAILGNLFGQCFVYSVVRKGSVTVHESVREEDRSDDKENNEE